MAFLAVSCGGSDQNVDVANQATGSNDDGTSRSTESSTEPSAESATDGPEDDENGVIPGFEEPTAGPSATASAGSTDDDNTGTRGGRDVSSTPTPRPPTPTTVDRATAVPDLLVTPTATATAAQLATPTAVVTATPEPTLTPSAAAFSGATPTPTTPPTATVVSPTVTSTVVYPSATPIAQVYFETLPPGSSLPSGAECAALVRAHPSPETHPGNATANSRTGGPQVLIDGAHGFRGDSLAARINGNFTGSTNDILRWASCKWGIDEDITRARAWTESSWRISTAGDQTDTATACNLLGLSTPCSQSYGLLQVKGTVHEGTYPYSFESTAWGVDYAMAWQRACFEGAFTWLDDQGYSAGDLRGCIGAWYSGEWYDAGANRYLTDVASNMASRPWG